MLHRQVPLAAAALFALAFCALFAPGVRPACADPVIPPVTWASMSDPYVTGQPDWVEQNGRLMVGFSRGLGVSGLEEFRAIAEFDLQNYTPPTSHICFNGWVYQNIHTPPETDTQSVLVYGYTGNGQIDLADWGAGDLLWSGTIGSIGTGFSVDLDTWVRAQILAGNRYIGLNFRPGSGWPPLPSETRWFSSPSNNIAPVVGPAVVAAYDYPGPTWTTYPQNTDPSFPVVNLGPVGASGVGLALTPEPGAASGLLLLFAASVLALPHRRTRS